MTNPLTGGTTGAVADALIEQGYQTTRATVNRWARGDEMPGIAALMILELFGHSPETTRAAAPLEGRLLAGTIALERKLGITSDELAAAEAEAMVLVARLLGTDGTPLPRSGGGGADGAGG